MTRPPVPALTDAELDAVLGDADGVPLPTLEEAAGMIATRLRQCTGAARAGDEVAVPAGLLWLAATWLDALAGLSREATA